MKRLLLSLIFTALFVAIMERPALVQLVHAACVSQTAGELTAKLTWTNADPVTTDSVNVLRSNTAGGETLLLTIPYGTSYTDIVPVPTSQISYFYEVQAKGPGGVSVPSNESCKTFFPGPAAPTSLQVQ